MATRPKVLKSLAITAMLATACALFSTGCGLPVVAHQDPSGDVPGMASEGPGPPAAPPELTDLRARLGLTATPDSDCLVYADLNGDGTDDLVMTVQGQGLGVYLNSHRGGFLPFLPIPLSPSTSGTFLSSCAAVDMDNDGATDLVVLRGNGELAVLRGTSGPTPTFHESPVQTLVNASFIRPVDLNRDGWMDLFAGASYHGNDGQITCDTTMAVPLCQITGATAPYPYVLLRQPGTAFTFTTVTLPVAGYSNGAALGDIDGNGSVDLFSSNELGVDALFAYRGGTSFIDVLPAHLTPRFNQGMGAAWGAINGTPCLYNADFGPSELYCQQPDGTLRDIAPETGIAAASRFDVAWAPIFWDANNDGYTDIYVGNAVSAAGRDEFIASYMEAVTYADVYDLFLVGAPGPSFTPVRVAPTFMHPTMGTEVLTAVGDYDGDGLQEIAVSRPEALAMTRFELIAPQPRGPRGHWLAVQLSRGGSPPAPRNILGATVFLRDGDTVFDWQTVGSGGGLASSSTTARFGLGARTRVDSIGVRWPDGATDITWTPGPFPADHVTRITEHR